MSATPDDLFGPPKGWLTNVYRKRLFMIVVGEPDYFRRDFMSWLQGNYHVWIAFEHEAGRLWSRGFKHYGARTIGEWLRHETAVREGPNANGWKLNDHYWPDLARLYMLMHPDRVGFFETRVGPLSARAR